jgi:hypothetical protein
VRQARRGALSGKPGVLTRGIAIPLADDDYGAEDEPAAPIAETGRARPDRGEGESTASRHRTGRPRGAGPRARMVELPEGHGHGWSPARSGPRHARRTPASSHAQPGREESCPRPRRRGRRPSPQPRPRNRPGADGQVERHREGIDSAAI